MSSLVDVESTRAVAYGRSMGRPVVFWVEDNEHDVELMRTAFVIAGVDADFVVAEQAHAAFRYVDGLTPYKGTPRPPDLIILDLRLPAISGESVLAELRKHRSFSTVPIVIFTSSADPRELQRCRDHGATECITKPPSFGGYAEVVTLLKRYLPTSGGNPALDRDPEPVKPDDPPSSSILVPGPARSAKT